MKNVKSIIYLLAVVFSITGCTDDDTAEEPSKVTAVRLGAVSDFTGPCSKKIDFEAEIDADGPMTVSYTWLRSDGATAPENSITFEEAGTKKVTTSWTLGANGESYEGYWQQLKVISPEEILSNKAEFNLHCEEEEAVTITTTTAVVGENSFTGPCSKKFDFEAEIDVDGPTTITYTWLRSDGATAPENTIIFEEAGTKKVTTSWTLGENGESYEGYWQQLKIISPEEILSNKAEFDLHCEEDTVTITATTAVVGENSFTGPCPKKFDFETEIDADGPTTITYTWLRSDGATAPENTIIFEEAGTKKVTTSWTLGGSGESYEGYWQQLKIISPEEIFSSKAEFNLYCESEENVELVSLSPDSPSTLFVGERVEFTFNYITSEAAGVRIFGRPFTSGSPTPGYAAHGSPLHATGEGSSNGYFTIQENSQHVDQIRFQMWDADQSNLLYEFFVDVDYQYLANIVVLDNLEPGTNSTLVEGERVNFDFHYKTNEPGGVRIFGRPFTNGSPTPGYKAHPSGIHPVGEGNGSGYFTVSIAETITPHVVDQIRFQMWDADQNNLLYEYFVNVDYVFTE